MPLGGLLVEQGQLNHERVERDRSRMVPDQECGPFVWHILDAGDLDVEPFAVQGAQRPESDVLGEFGVETELVDVVVARHASRQQVEQFLKLACRRFRCYLSGGFGGLGVSVAHGLSFLPSMLPTRSKNDGSGVSPNHDINASPVTKSSKASVVARGSSPKS